MIYNKSVNTVIIAALDRLTRSVKDLAELLKRFTQRVVSLVSVSECLDTLTAAAWGLLAVAHG